MLPFFVYGTLLPEQPNFHYWQGAIERITLATLHDATLFSMGNFPMMVWRPSSMVRGAVVEISAEAYPYVLAGIDRLECYDPDRPDDSFYQREQVTVQTITGERITAWTYVGDEATVRGKHHIGGDWVGFSAEANPTINRWWQRYNAAGQHNLLN